MTNTNKIVIKNSPVHYEFYDLIEVGDYVEMKLDWEGTPFKEVE
jgi:hypothetical protein